MKKVFFLLMASAVFTIWACKKDNATTGPTLELRLTDGPANYQAVNIEIIGAEVHVNKDTGNASGWQPLSIRTGVFNILALNNGLDTLLGSTVLPVADISEIRLKLGTNNTIKVAGQTYALTIPSGGESGLKLKFEKKLVAGVSYIVTLDFDAAKSIKEEKNNQYKLKPTLRLITEANNGSIRGEIAPATCKSVVYAVSGTDTLTSAYPSSLGKFVLQGLDAGTFKVVVDADLCADKVIPNVSVQVGKATDIGKIQL